MNQNHATAGQGLIGMIAGVLALALQPHAAVILGAAMAVNGIIHAVKPLLRTPAQKQLADQLTGDRE